MQASINWWARGRAPGPFCNINTIIDEGWIVIEIATIISGLLFIFVVPFPFMLSPVAFALWFMSMDIVPMLAGYR